MCGILGLASFSKQGVTGWQYEMFFQLLYAGALRGMHGTGATAIDVRGQHYSAKIGGPPHQLVATDVYTGLEKFVEKNDVRFLLGHNRYATRGKKITEHAHPFRHGNIVLVHNGTLGSYNHFPKDQHFAVDSEALCNAIDKMGVDDAIKDLVGAWAIVYWDRKEKTINFLRNDQRPMHLAIVDKGELILWASEKEMLEWVISRNHYWDYRIEELPTEELVTISIDEDTKKEDFKFRHRTVKGRPFPKKSNKHYEAELEKVLGAQDAFELSGTSESVSKDIEVVYTPKRVSPVVPSSSAAARAPTGKVALLTAPKPAEHGKGSWTRVDHLHELSKGGLIQVELFNYDALNNNGQFMLEFTHKKYPDVEFVSYVKGSDQIDPFIEAKQGAIGMIASILKSNDSTAKCAHRVYLHNLTPANDQEPEVPTNAYVG